MHVLYFVQHFSTPAGSTSNRAYWFARALADRDHAVTVVTGSYAGADTGLTGPFRRGRRTGRVDGLDVIEFDLAYSNDLGLLRRSMVFARFALRSTAVAVRADADIVFATSTPLTTAIPALAARWLRRRPMVFEVRDLWPELPRAMGVITNRAVLAGLSALEWAAYRSSRRLIGLSPGIVRGIARRGVAPADIAMIPNASDVDAIADLRPFRPDGVDADDLVAVYAGTHGLANGLDHVLDAAAELQRRGARRIRIVLVGSGGAKAGLVDRARREALDNVVFLDPVPKRQLFELLGGADIGIQALDDVPAFYDGTSPNKFFDYLAAGLPVLNNYPGWLAEMIGERRIGYAIAPGDPAAFADALEHAAAHRDDLARMGDAAAGLAREQFARNDLAARFCDWVLGAVE